MLRAERRKATLVDRPEWLRDVLGQAKRFGCIGCGNV